MNSNEQVQQIVSEIRQTGFSFNNRPRRRLVRINTALALSPVGTGFPALLLLQAGETVPGAVLGLVAVALFVAACAKLEVIWK